MKSNYWKWLVVLVGLSASLAAAFNARPPVTEADLFHAQQVRMYILTNDLALERFGKPWTLGEKDKCNFTYFSPEVQELTFSAKGLSFKTAGDKAIAGWGNYDGRQAQADRIMMYSGWNEIEMKVRQSATASVWKVELWANGKTKVGTYSSERLSWRHVPEATVEVKGPNWQTIRFKAYKAGADGFGLTIQGPAGNAVEIESFRIMQTQGQGCYRRDFELPRGKIWRAVGEISKGITLMINGREVDIASTMEQTAPVDFTPYLEPGHKNVICLFARQSPAALEPPLVYLQGRAIMTDGTELSLDTDARWVGNGREEKDWTASGYDAGAWKPAMAAPAPLDSFIRRWPVYDGRLLLENPGKDPRLYFDAAEPVRVNVRLPEGLAKDQPALRWVLRRVERENERPEAGRGAVDQCAPDRKTASAIYSVDAGKLASGVYTLEVELTAGNKVLERRFEEPLIVVERLPMKETAGNSYEEGMELELEDVIDFTDPDDPHRWVEAVPQGDQPTRGITQPKIVRKDGLVYREVTEAQGAAMFSYRFEFRDPRSWYLLVLEYPNDAERWIGVSVTSAGGRLGYQPMAPWRLLEGGWNSEDGPSLVTGDKYPLDNKLHEMRWLHWADPEIHTLDIVNLKKGLRAAAARLRIYRVKQLPAVAINTSGGRFFGIHTERARSLGRTFSDSDGSDPYQRRYDNLGYDMLARFAQRLRWHFDACRNYTAYLRFTGQNLHVMGSYQYSEANTSYTPPERVPGDGRLLQDIRETALRFFERNGITMYSMVEYICDTSLRAKYAVGDADVAQGADTINFVNKDGKQGGWIANPNHPATEAGYLRVVDDLATKFAFSPAWKGIYYCVCPDSGSFGPGPCIVNSAPFDYDYSDATMALFEKDTKIKVPGEPKDPKRFNQRYLFLTSDAMRAQWTDWRCRNTASYMTKTLAQLRRYRPDLNVLYGLHLAGGACRYWLYESGKPYRDFFREMAMDPSVVKDQPNIWFGRYVYPTGPASAGESYFWEHFVGPEPNAYFGVEGNRMTTLCTCWHELPTSVPGWSQGKAASDSTSAGAGKIANIPEGWPMPANVSRFISQAHDDNVLEPFTEAMIGTDPDLLIYGFTDVNIINSREQHMREVAKVVTALPKDRFEPVQGTTDFKHDLAIRALSKGGAYWFYVANPCPWPVKGGVTLSGKAAVVTPGDGQPVATREADGKTAVPVALKPYGIMAYRAAGDVAVAQWNAAPADDTATRHMQGIIKAVNEIMEDPKASLAITREDRDFMRGIIKNAEELLQAGKFAAAWSELTNWRFWGLWKKQLVPAREFSARLPGRPGMADRLDTWERPELAVMAVQGAAPVIDGKLDDAIWKSAPASYRFLSISGSACNGAPVVDTAVQACHDRDKLYVALRMADADVKALRKTAVPETPVQVLRKYDDTVVMFLNAEADRVRQFAVNAGGVKYFAGSGEWGITADDLCKTQWDAAVGVENGAWTVEAAIPFAALEAPAPKAGGKWRANFLRRFREFKIPESYWARVKTGWSDANCYGTLTFQ